MLKTSFYFYNKFIEDDNSEVDFIMSSEDSENPIIFAEKVKGKKIAVLRIPEYLGKQTSRHRFMFWYDRDNPEFRVYPTQKYAVKAFKKKKEYVFVPYIKEVKKSIQLILKITDDYNSHIIFNHKDVFIKSYNTIQVDKNFISKFNKNCLHIICKMNPQLLDISDEVKAAVNENTARIFGYVENTKQEKVTSSQEVIESEETINVNSLDKTKKNSEVLKEFLEQEIDLPLQLVEVLMLGISAKARTANVVQIDPRAGTPYSINPYLERYELAIKKAVDNQFINQLPVGRRDVSVKGFV